QATRHVRHVLSMDHGCTAFGVLALPKSIPRVSGSSWVSRGMKRKQNGWGWQGGWQAGWAGAWQREDWRDWKSGGAASKKPFWRRFVDPSDNPEVIQWCRERVQAFLDSGRSQEEMEWLSNEYRNTIRSLAPEMGAAWIKVSKGIYALACSKENLEPVRLRQRLVEEVRKSCMKAGGSCKASWVWRDIPQDLWVSAATTLKLRNIKSLPDVCPQECQDAQLRLSKSTFKVGEADDFEDALHVHFDASHLAAAAGVVAAASRAPRRQRSAQDAQGLDFLRRPSMAMGPEDLRREQERPGYVKMLPMRQHLPAFHMAKEICSSVRDNQVTLILGATGCGKTTQIPQFLLEDCTLRGEPCRLVATQPRRISAVSVADRVATERGQTLGESVAFKIRFEDEITETTQVIFCTVGILLKVMQSNQYLEGATHIVVDEVHERGLHTDFLLILLRRLLKERPELRVVLMSATVDPSAFQAYFEGINTVSIPGKTNYPIEELFLEDFLLQLPELGGWRSNRQIRSSPFSQKPLAVPLDWEGVAAVLGESALVEEVVRVHNEMADVIDLELVLRVVKMIHQGGEEGGILIFMPGWAEIKEIIDRLKGQSFAGDLVIHALHSRLPTWEQKQIFQSPPEGQRKVVVATVLAETSITVEDVVYVIDPGRSRTTFFNEQTMISALRTVWYSKANGFQRRGRAGRCRPGVWYRLYTSMQWDAMEEYELPEMLRSPLEELCLEVASLGLGVPEEFLQEAISPPRAEVLQHAVELLQRLGAVEGRGETVTPLGAKLAKLQVHPMLAKLLLLAAPFRCFDMMLTICASLGYKPPFICPMGMEKAANKVLHEVPEDHADHQARANACKAVLTAGLYPNLAWLHGKGRGKTLQNLPVKPHPGSVNAAESHCLMVFYEIQETTDRWLYDSTVIGAAPLLLFAPALTEVHRKQRVVFELERWHMAVDVRVADELLKLRRLLASFVNDVVGERLTPTQLQAAEALQKVFAEQVETTGGTEDEAEGGDGENSANNSVIEDAWDSQPQA
ncbi:DExH-box ATP-dependent RNA helicase DExH1, partial [Durusdinium trenchii]